MPIDWISKRQGTIKPARYGSEFVATRITTDNIVELRYTLRMLGVPILDASYVFGDNQAVVNSSMIPEYNLKKRHNALAYHRVREAIAAGIIQYYHIDGKENPADVLRKFLPHSKWWLLVKPLLHWLEEVNKKVSKARKKITKYQPVWVLRGERKKEGEREDD